MITGAMVVCATPRGKPGTCPGPPDHDRSGVQDTGAGLRRPRSHGGVGSGRVRDRAGNVGHPTRLGHRVEPRASRGDRRGRGGAHRVLLRIRREPDVNATSAPSAPVNR
ncbi:hypothetical protein UO65_4908 [Actinokineospora spheciospongiae]|uniref:Uncharacterized protein n=1 Tax=Actinokineospora spheciospongiae TaxID=909613 RepID=W7IFU7_9PSEU|nr:hypothetical protein UO65_4908 [Actinokineospora spheciospongiae]